MGLIPALKTLLETPWMALAGVATRQDARMLLKNVHGLSTLGDICIAKNFCLQWDDDCPSCFQYEFDDPLPAIGKLFSSWQPSFERTSIVLHDCAVLDNITGEEIKILKSFHVRLLCHLRTRMSSSFGGLTNASTATIIHLSPKMFRAPAILESSSTGSSFVPVGGAHSRSLLFVSVV
jgi:hypothetical protein